jgi:DNA repair exonuclease SbcCD ATPase subunit
MVVVTGTTVIIIFFSCSAIGLAAPNIVRRAQRGVQRIRRYAKSISEKNRYKKFIKSTKIVKSQEDCKEEDCAICLDDYSENNKCSELYCGHKFHNNCFREWILHREVCPLCNTELSNKNNECTDGYLKLK